MSSTLLILAAFFGLLSVALGAFGAHALKETLDAYGTDIWNKAVLYQMFHTLALLALYLLAGQKNLNLTPAAWSFVAGIVLFSGSLYVLAFSGVKLWGAVTPFGGLAFLFGWGWLAWQAFRAPGN